MKNAECPRCGNIFTMKKILNDTFKCYSCGKLIVEGASLKKDEFIYELSECGAYYAIVDKGAADSKETVIPEFYNNLPVRKIKELAFEGSIMEKLIISANLIEIEKKSFLNCDNLKKIIVNKNNKKFDSRKHCNGIILSDKNELILGCKKTRLVSSIKIIGESAYKGCVGLKKIKIPKTIVEIKPYAFSACIDLSKILIPSIITKIPAGCFAYCNFKNIKINNEITEIGEYAFYNCKKLENIELSKNLKIIYKYAFANCNNLKTIQLPDKLKRIKHGAFMNCNCLTILKIPSSVRLIEAGAFRNCDNLKEVTAYNKRENIEHGAFEFNVEIDYYGEEWF